MIFHFLIFFLLILFLFLWCIVFVDSFKNAKTPYLKLATCIICLCLFKCDWGIHFLGLEYEDAYSFSAYTRQLSFGIFSDSLRVQCIDIGSLSEPLSLGTYGGHYITYPILLYIFTAIFGFSFTTISIINSGIALLSILTIAFYNYQNKYGWIVAVLLFCCAPAINLFSTCFLSESFSSFLCICFVLYYLNSRDNTIIHYRLFILISFFLCILTKRENIILLIIPGIYCIKAIYNNNYKLALKEIFPYLFIFLTTTIFIHNFMIAEIEETSDISQSTFSLGIFSYQFPIYIKSLLSISYFSICLPIFILSLILDVVYRNWNIKLTCLLCLFCCSLIMYSAHYRGYYFIENIETFNEFATFRYINNFFYILPLFIALSFDVSYKYARIILVGLMILCFISVYLTYNLRVINSKEEYTVRFNDIEIINQTTDENDVIITDVPLLFLNVSSPQKNICNVQRISEINFNSSHKFYILVDDWYTIDKRYKLNLSNYNKRLVQVLPSNKKLYLIE